MPSKITTLTAVVLVGMIVFSNPILGETLNHKKRVISDSTSFLSKLLFRIQGCSVVHELDDGTAFECPPGVVKRYELREDRLFQVLDIDADRQIGASSVWQEHNATGKGVVVAVLDTGVDVDHPEISGSVVGGLSFIGYSDTVFYDDDHGHGTQVSGIITSDGLDELSKGVAPDAGIWTGKVCNKAGSCWESDVASAIEYVVDNNIARVITLSLGRKGTQSPNCNQDYLAKKVNWASQNQVVVVAAAGNSGSDISSPACASEAIAVGSVDKTDYLATTSGRGRALDLVAPGVNIYSTVLDGGYASWSGTSMATPMVSGTVALLLEKNSSLTVSEIKTSLYESAIDLRYSSREQGNGRVDANRAYEYDHGSLGDGSNPCPMGKAKKGLC
jgi:subtilisin family serine protease